MSLKFKSIVLTDDDEDDRFFFQEALDALNFDITYNQFEDGSELMNHLKSTLINLPSLLFLDLNMPKKSGLECLKEIRADEVLKDLFVIIYSTSSSENDILKAYEVGADNYLSKPTSFKNLKSSLFNILTRLEKKNTLNNDLKSFLLNFH